MNELNKLMLIYKKYILLRNKFKKKNSFQHMIFIQLKSILVICFFHTFNVKMTIKLAFYKTKKPEITRSQV